MVIFYSAMCGGSGERLLQIIEGIVLEENIEICRNVDALSKALCQPRGRAAIAILLTSNGRDLLDILSLRDLLLDIKIILILPNSDPKTVSKGHTLRPRFMSDCDSNFQDVAAVLKRMIENLNINKKMPKMNREEVVAS
jgi:hypothetical protein